MTHTLYIERYRKVDGVWTLKETNENTSYNLDLWEENILDSRDFFKKLGGTERLTRGTNPTLTSISPNGDSKSVYRLRKNYI